MQTVVYLFRLSDGQYIYVGFNPPPELTCSWKMFIGPPEAMKEISIQRIRRQSDGGTKLFMTAEGTLYAPVSGDASWEGAKLEKLDPESFRITETEQGVQVCPVS